MFKREKIHSVVINMEQKVFDAGLAQRLADNMGAVCYTVDELRGGYPLRNRAKRDHRAKWT